MTSGATTTRHGPIALIRFFHEPVNTLAHAMRVAVHRELRAAFDDSAVRAVVLSGEGRGFCAGAQITEFASGEIAAAPTAHDIWAMIEASTKPVIAAIHGYALGGGLEFAMACHYRVALQTARLGLPEVLLGLLPGSGGTQRLTRALGVERALEMMITGERLAASEFAGTLLVDALASCDVVEAAIGFALDLGTKTPPRRLRDIKARIDDAPNFFALARRAIAKRFPGKHAPLAIADCVAIAATLPFEDGLSYERARFQDLVNNEQSKAMRQAFFAERQIRRLPVN
ncbi:MAG: enoyl-CoA hydratase/isomerase family protein [Burkholderiales bacterium]